jgi:hypothetical protein
MPVFFKEILLYLDTKWSRSLIFRLPDALVYSVYRTDFPDKPTSNKTKPLSTESSLEDKMAATARSIAGSSTCPSGYVEENVFGAKPETLFQNC